MSCLRAIWFGAILFFFLSSSLASAAANKRPRPLWGYLNAAPAAEAHIDARAFKPGSLPLGQAAVEIDQAKEGRVLEISFSHTGTALFYAATTGSSSGLRYLRIDPITGQASETSRPQVTRAQLDAQGLRSLALLGSAKYTLVQAITAAETLTGNQAISAGVEQLNGVPQYYIQTVHAGTLAGAVIVNPQTGRAAQPMK